MSDGVLAKKFSLRNGIMTSEGRLELRIFRACDLYKMKLKPMFGSFLSAIAECHLQRSIPHKGVFADVGRNYVWCNTVEQQTLNNWLCNALCCDFFKDNCHGPSLNPNTLTSSKYLQANVAPLRTVHRKFQAQFWSGSHKMRRAVRPCCVVACGT